MSAMEGVKMSTSAKALLILPRDNMDEVRKAFDEVHPGWKEEGLMTIWEETLVVLVSLPPSTTNQPGAETLAALRQRETLSFYASESYLSAESSEPIQPASSQALFGMKGQQGWFVLLIASDRGDLSVQIANYIQARSQREGERIGRSDWHKLNEVKWRRFILPADVNTASWLVAFVDAYPGITLSSAVRTIVTEFLTLPGLDVF